MRILHHLAGLLFLAAASPAEADPALWVAHSGGTTVYLFGTVHVLPAGTQWMDAAIRTALAASSEVWTEADVSSLRESVVAIRHYGLGAQHPVEQLLPPAYRERYREQVIQTGVPLALFERAQPWLAEILLSAAAMQHAGAMGVGRRGIADELRARPPYRDAVFRDARCPVRHDGGHAGGHPARLAGGADRRIR